MTTLSDEETRELARQLILKHRPVLDRGCVVLSLSGDLGAGKTVFTKGIAQGLRIEDEISSPSYVYVHEHKHQLGKLVHIDLWRVEREVDFQDLKLSDYLKPGNVVVVEWPKEFFESELARVEEDVDFEIFSIEVRIEVQETLRKIEISEEFNF